MIQILKQQEEALEFDAFSNEDAFEIGVLLVEYAKAKQVAVAIEIVVNGWPVFLHAMQGTRPENNRWLRRKRNFLEYRHTSSLLGQQMLLVQNKTLHDLALDESEYSDKGGSFPIRIVGQVIGSITVSGRPDTEDHQLVVDVLGKYLKKTVPSILQ